MFTCALCISWGFLSLVRLEDLRGLGLNGRRRTAALADLGIKGLGDQGLGFRG